MIPRGTVLEHALTVATRDGLHNITRSAVADEAGVSSGTVSNAFGGMPALIDAVVEEAFRRGLTAVVCQAVAMRHDSACSRVRRWPNSQKLELLQSVL